MPDFTNELRQLADSATAAARPLPATEVLRRGDRRRRISIAQRAAGGLSVLGLIAAVIVTTGNTSSLAGPSSPTAPATSGSTQNSISMTDTVTATAGTMTIQAEYLLGTGGRIKLISVTFSGHAKHAVKNSKVIFNFGPNLAATSFSARKRSIFFYGISVKLNSAHDFSGSLPARDVTKIRQHGGLFGNEPLAVTLESFVMSDGGVAHVPVLAAQGVILATP